MGEREDERESMRRTEGGRRREVERKRGRGREREKGE